MLFGFLDPVTWAIFLFFPAVLSFISWCNRVIDGKVANVSKNNLSILPQDFSPSEYEKARLIKIIYISCIGNLTYLTLIGLKARSLF